MPLLAQEKNGMAPWSRTPWNVVASNRHGPPQPGEENGEDQCARLTCLPPALRCSKLVTAFQSHGASVPVNCLPTHAPQSSRPPEAAAGDVVALVGVEGQNRARQCLAAGPSAGRTRGASRTTNSAAGTGRTRAGRGSTGKLSCGRGAKRPSHVRAAG